MKSAIALGIENEKADVEISMPTKLLPDIFGDVESPFVTVDSHSEVLGN